MVKADLFFGDSLTNVMMPNMNVFSTRMTNVVLDVVKRRLRVCENWYGIRYESSKEEVVDLLTEHLEESSFLTSFSNCHVFIFHGGEGYNTLFGGFPDDWAAVHETNVCRSRFRIVGI